MHDDRERLPVGALLALAMTGFICIMTETLPAGLLPAISSDLDISPSLAGQMVTAYALGSVIAAIPLTLATQGWRRRRVLLSTVLGFLIFNSITALSTNVPLTLAARFFAGAAAGLAWSLLAGYARRMVAPVNQGRALAMAMVGTPIALSLGVPLGTWMGNLLGWRWTFAVMSLITVGLVAWILIKVPDYPGQIASKREPILAVLRKPGIRPVLAVVLAWMLAHNILYTYIAPYAAQFGLEQNVDLILLAFGAASLLGIWITGRLVDQHLRWAVLISLGSFALVSLLMALFEFSAAGLYAAVLVWGLSFGGAATLLQTALADAAGEAADAALSMNVVVWNCAIAGAGILGGLLLDSLGVRSFPWALLGLLLVALAIASAATRHGFVAGKRRIVATA
jgi:predicted MFS family arabinose efflux permease